jgi:hypothetical protein
MDEARPTDPTKTVREAVGVFSDPERLQDAATELQTAGFNHADISMLASEHALRDKLGHVYGGTPAVEDDPKAPRQPYHSPPDIGDAKGVLIGAPMYVAATLAAGVIAATGGTLAALLGGVALAGGAGGLVGYAFANRVDKNYAEELMGALEAGGLLLWVRTPSVEQEARAMEILSKHGARHVHAHELNVPPDQRGPLREFFSDRNVERI